MSRLALPLSGKLALLAAILCTSFRAFSQDNTLDVSRWDQLIKDTGTTPIIIPPDSVTQAAVDAAYDRWLIKNLLKPALASLKGDPDEAELGKVLEGIVHRNSGVDAAIAEAPVRDQVRRFAKRKTRQPCIDFLLATALNAANYWDEARVLFHAAAESAEDTPFPLLFRLIAQAHVLKEAADFGRGDKGAAERRYFDLFARHLTEPMDGDDVRFTVRNHVDEPIASVRWDREGQYIKMYKESPLPDWARLTCIGLAELQTAWREDNRGMTSPDDAGKKRRDEAVVRAKAALAKAWELNPSMHYAPWQMIVAGRMSQAPRADLRLWLDRTIAAVSDYLPAYRDYINGISPSYMRGDLPSMLAFGRVCAETRRYDLRIPDVFSETLIRIGADLDDWHSLYDQPGIAQMLIETRRHRVEKASAGEHNLQLNELALEGWLTGNYDIAAKALNEIRDADGSPLGSWATAKEAQRLDVAIPFVFRDSLLRSGAGHEEYEEGARLLSSGKPTEAEPHLKSALAAAKPWEGHLMGSDLLLVDFQKQYATGEWTPLPLQERLCWTQHEGVSDWQPEIKRLRLQSTGFFSRTTFRGNLGASYELRGHLFATRGDHPKGAGLGIYCGHSPFGFGANCAWWWTLRIDSRDADHFWIHHAPKYDGQPQSERQEVAWKDDATFLYRCKRGKISFAMEGRELIHDAVIEADRPYGENAFGFGILGHGAGSIVEIWGWEARRLDFSL